MASESREARAVERIAPPISREHYIEIFGGGNYQRGLQWLREEGLYVGRTEEGLGWTVEKKPEVIRR